MLLLSISFICITEPNVPENLEETNATNQTSFTVKWDMPSDTEQVDGFDWSVVGTAISNNTTNSTLCATVTGLQHPGETYEFSVKAKTTDGTKTAYSREGKILVTTSMWLISYTLIFFGYFVQITCYQSRDQENISN